MSIPIGLVIPSAFSVMVVDAQELMPGRVGMISGLFFGLAFGIPGLVRFYLECWLMRQASLSFSKSVVFCQHSDSWCTCYLTSARDDLLNTVSTPSIRAVDDNSETVPGCARLFVWPFVARLCPGCSDDM
jgi:hypothetical protein